MIPTTLALTLLPQEQLTLAHSHETGELQRYRRLSLSFLPAMPQASQLMASLGNQCEQRLKALCDVAHDMALGACVEEKARDSGSFAMTHRHAFIVDEIMGEQVLQQALGAAIETHHFFQWLSDTNATPELHRPFLLIAQQKESEARVMLEFIEQRNGVALRRNAG